MEDEDSDPAVKVYYLVAKKFKHIDIKRKQMFQGKMFDTKWVEWIVNVLEL